MKHLLNNKTNQSTQFLWLRTPEGEAVTPRVETASPVVTNPEAAAAELVNRNPRVDFSEAVRGVEGAEAITPLVNQLQARVNPEEAFADITNTLRAFSETDLGAEGGNLFSMFIKLMEDLGVDFEEDDQENETGSNRTSSNRTGGATESGPIAEVPPNEEMPELDETPSAEDMAMLQSRAGSADVVNMTNPAKNIAIETLRAHPNLRVTSGYRDPERNRRAGGVDGSDHLTGNAIDFGTIDPAVGRWVEAAFPGQVYTLIHGNSRNPDPTHLHVSYRPGGNRVA
jgi:hypothetical protein